MYLKQHEILGIKDYDVIENSYTVNDFTYSVLDLIELSKKYEPFDLPLKGIDIAVKPWGDIDIKRFAYHMLRVEKADLNFPIILDECGYICDGWHRLIKAIIKGDEFIKAIRLPIMPQPK